MSVASPQDVLLTFYTQVSPSIPVCRCDGVKSGQRNTNKPLECRSEALREWRARNVVICGEIWYHGLLKAGDKRIKYEADK